MRLSYTAARTNTLFDDPDLVSHGGLVPVMALAERPAETPGQGELFPAWCYHAVFTDNPYELV